jgi:hypothetical protein
MNSTVHPNPPPRGAKKHATYTHLYLSWQLFDWLSQKLSQQKEIEFGDLRMLWKQPLQHAETGKMAGVQIQLSLLSPRVTGAHIETWKSKTSRIMCD